MKTTYIVMALGAGVGACLFALMPAGAATSANSETAKGSPETGSAYVKPEIKHEQYGSVNIVVPLTTDDKAIQNMKLGNLQNTLNALQEWGGAAHSTVVVYAKGLSLLKAPDEATRSKIDALKRRGVRFDVCNNSLREQGVDYHTLYEVRDQDIVPSGFAEVAYLQAKKHYVVDPAN